MPLSEREEKIFASIAQEFGHAESVQTGRAALATGAVLMLGTAPVAWTLAIAPWTATLSLLLVLATAYLVAREVLGGTLWSKPRRPPTRIRRLRTRRW